MNHRPRKRFGQNFLHDAHVVGRIVRAMAPGPGDAVVEIGPGLGALTAPLVEAAGELDAVEVDRDLVTHLADRFGGRLRLHQADALAFDFCSLTTGKRRLRVVGNLPYNISTPLLFHLMEQSACLRDMHFMLQREVVERLSSGPGGRDYGRLSVMVQYRCRVERLFNVPPGAFRPPPKVHSAIVRLIPYAHPPVAVNDPATLARIVSQAFSQRRKTLRNALRSMVTLETFERLGLDPMRRPETLSLEEFAMLANAFDAVEEAAFRD